MARIADLFSIFGLASFDGARDSVGRSPEASASQLPLERVFVGATGRNSVLQPVPTCFGNENDLAVHRCPHGHSFFGDGTSSIIDGTYLIGSRGVETETITT